MSKSTKHTPTPWKAGGRRIFDANGLFVVSTRYETPADVLAIGFIVRAVNSHAALVEALEATSKILIELLRIADNDYADDIDSGLIKARAALTLAKGA